MYVLATEDIKNDGLRTGKCLSGKANRNGCFGISGERGKLLRKRRGHLLFSHFFVFFVAVLKESGTASDIRNTQRLLMQVNQLLDFRKEVVPDGSRCRKIGKDVVNLLSNVFRFTPEGGQ